MIALAFFKWWYGPGWFNAAPALRRHLRATYDGFSVPLLCATLVSPWRRIVTLPGGSLGERFRAWADNGLSRVIGLAVRLLTLTAAGLTAAFWVLYTLIRLVIWPCLPVAGLLLVLGIAS